MSNQIKPCDVIINSDEQNQAKNAYAKWMRQDEASRSRNESPKKPSMNKRVQCPDCNKTFAFRQALRAHIRYAHRGEQKHQCHKCAQHFLSKRDLLRHNLRTLCVLCEECNTGFESKMERSHHNCGDNKTKKPFACGQCSKRFKINRDLVTHSIVQYSDSRQFECDLCEKRFKHKRSVYKHVNNFYFISKTH